MSERVRGGEDLRFAVREFLDEFSLLPRDDLRHRAIGARPELTRDSRADAYLGALAEHLAATHGMERPAWSVESERFLERFWFVSEVSGFRALAIAQSPAAFRRRGIFVANGAGPRDRAIARCVPASRDLRGERRAPARLTRWIGPR